MKKLILISALLFSFNTSAKDYACGALSTDYVGENLEEETCSNRDGQNVALHEFWMAHAWIVRPWLTHEDVFTNHHPCLAKEGLIEDYEDECWGETMGHVGHDIE